MAFYRFHGLGVTSRSIPGDITCFYGGDIISLWYKRGEWIPLQWTKQVVDAASHTILNRRPLKDAAAPFATKSLFLHCTTFHAI
jgi:hypothetical protein